MSLYRLAERRLKRLLGAQAGHLLRHGRIGLEKESLRVSSQGGIAQTPHSPGLGSALTNSYITTDYSEALLELVTPPFQGIEPALSFLRDAHKFVYDHLGDETLWATSMPCILEGADAIPVAFYGNSNIGTMKTVYREGLGHRYGRVMQVIAGVHFNYSPSEQLWSRFQDLEGDGRSPRAFRDELFLAQVRNIQRYGWLIPYLFGASPAVCKTFLEGRPTNLAAFDRYTYYGPFATSLRMGDIGYTNKKEEGAGIKVDYGSLDSYVASLERAIRTPCPAWEHIGIKVNGSYRQLNANILQIENEYYSTVRPKQVPDKYEMPALALRRRGVRYVELRSLDVSAFDSCGISETQLHFLEAFMLFCLLQESPPIGAEEQREIDDNLLQTAQRGRDPELKLRRRGQDIRLQDWARELCLAMEGICEQLDGEGNGRSYQEALAQCQRLVDEPELTPSARMLAEMRGQGEAFFHFAKRMSQRHRDWFDGLDISTERQCLFEQEAKASLERQAEIEAADELSFDAFLEAYFKQGSDGMG